jgi:hypothetical protein
MADACSPSYSGGRDQENLGSKPAQTNSLGRPSWKYPTSNRASGVARVVEHLPNKLKALSSHPSTTKKKKKKRRVNGHNFKIEGKKEFYEIILYMLFKM